MISTQPAPSQHPHNLSQPLHAPFRDHLALKRHLGDSMFHPPRRPTNSGRQGSHHGFSQGDFGVHRQGFYASDAPATSKMPQQLGHTVPEHMLRRKTPNGLLKAGYDGTPIEWASLPPAPKQQVRAYPRDETTDAAMRRQACVLLSGSGGGSNQYSSAHHAYAYTPSDAPSYQMRDSNPPHMNQWTAQVQQQQPQQQHQQQPMDSMLYQNTPQSGFLPSGYMNAAIALPPTGPRNIEPTASGPAMPYGPYWPNGIFEPYRPAELRDVRFQNQFAQITLNDPGDGNAWSRPHSDPDRPHRDSIYLGPATVGASAKLDGRGQRRLGMNSFAYNGGPVESYPPHGMPTFYPPSAASYSREPEHDEHAFPGGAGPPRLQFKEMAFAQAQRAYASLISYITMHRRQQQQKSGQKVIPNSNPMPKPPKGNYALNTDMHLQQKQLAYQFGSSLATQGGFQSSPMQTMIQEAQTALDLLKQLVQESGWTWTDGMLLGGCLAYGIHNLVEAAGWFEKVLRREPMNVEAMSNLAATFVAMGRRKDAEALWTDTIKRRPTYFEAVEHLIGLLAIEQRTADTISVIQHVEDALRLPGRPVEEMALAVRDPKAARYSGVGATGNPYVVGAAASGYRSSPTDNGRLIALIHAKGNMLYASGNIRGAAAAFEEAIMVAVGRVVDGITGLIRRILTCFADEIGRIKGDREALSPWDTILLLPKMAVRTVDLAFPNSSPLPGLVEVQEGSPKRAAIAVTSNCLLSLAKIYQDSVSSGSTILGPPSGTSGVQDILALYYLSLSLQPSPSTANNVGILLAGVQQSASKRLPAHLEDSQLPKLSGVVPGSGVALALSYYQYGLGLDSEHAHLYTNLGSLLKDLGHLDYAIQMYEKAVQCDGKFDIALANLANAVKDRGRISDAIGYYKRAVDANADFAEAVCGLANALNSVCGWSGRGGVVFEDRRFDRWHVNEGGMLLDARDAPANGTGWIGRVVQIVSKQLNDGRSWGKGVASDQEYRLLSRNAAVKDDAEAHRHGRTLQAWAGQEYEGAKLVRWVERATRRITWQWYRDKYVHKQERSTDFYRRPQVPAALSIPNAPTVLPFHTFTCPLTASQIRQISQRNGLRISASTLKAPWLPAHVFRPPPPPKPHLNVGYVSSDFNNHPLAHLMQSVFGMHDRSKVKAFCYATTPGDKSSHRDKIEKEAPVFHDASGWPVDRLVSQILADEIHILINLNGYTRGARNEVFAARPAPIQMSFMGFAGTLGAEWCDYLLADEIAVPPSTLRPNRNNVTLDDVVEDDNFGNKHDDWVYGENVIYTRDTFFCCDHRQSAPDADEAQLPWAQELQRRRMMRKEVFPTLPEDVVILGNFNQLYKIEPTTFRTWLRILQAVPKAILWLLRFPDLGEANLRAMAEKWTTPDVSGRIYFTDVAPKDQHISRARVCDLFLDTPECNAHTTAADVLWSGTPLLTYPRYAFKMCSRMAASILKGAMPRGHEGERAARELTVANDEEYEDKAIKLASGLVDVLCGQRKTCRVLEMRKLLYEGRWSSPLFNTQRWTSDLEEAYEKAWTRWEKGEGGDIWL